MRNIGILFFFVQLVFSQGMSAQVAELLGKQLNHGDGVIYFDDAGIYYGGSSNGFITSKGTWAYSVAEGAAVLELNGSIGVDLSFSSETAGSYVYYEVYEGQRLSSPDFTGTFTLGARTLVSIDPDWDYRDDFSGSSLNTNLWSAYSDSGDDTVVVADGQMSVLIDSQALEADTYAGADSTRLLPMNVSWELQTKVVVDLNKLTSASDYAVGCLLSNYDGTGAGGFEIQLNETGLSAGLINRSQPWESFQYASNDISWLESAHLRITHDLNSSVVRLAYDLDGAANGWSWQPLIEYNLNDGTGTKWLAGVASGFTGGTWSLNEDDYLRVDLEAHVAGTNGTYSAAPGDVGFDYFEMGSYVSPPASLAGKAYQFSPTDGFSTSVPWEIVFNETTYNLGFSGSIISQDVPYTYSNGELWLWRGDRVWVTFDSAKAGTYVYAEGIEDSTEDDDTTIVSPASIITNESLVSAIVQHEFQTIYTSSLGVDTTGTFSQVTPTLTLKNDWQRNETMDSVLLTDYWNVWSRSVDSLAYSGGALNFLFADGGDSANYDHPEIKIEYGRALPMDENWQVRLNDIDVSASVEQFDIALDFGVGAADFRCDLGYGDYGSGRGVAVWIRNGDRFGYAEALSVNNDALIANNLNLRVTHTASSRELRFEYQSVGASGWNELARLNLETGACTSGYWMYGEGFSGQLFSSSERLSLEIDAESGQATQFGDLKIGGIEIGSYTPSETTWYAGASYVSDGWRYFGWFKGFKPAGANWIYHGRHGWLYTLGADTSSLFLWDVALGRWMFTNETAYPWIYAYGPDGGWVFFFEGGRPGSRYFKRGDNGQTLSEQQLRMAP